MSSAIQAPRAGHYPNADVKKISYSLAGISAVIIGYYLLARKAHLFRAIHVTSVRPVFAAAIPISSTVKETMKTQRKIQKLVFGVCAFLTIAAGAYATRNIEAATLSPNMQISRRQMLATRDAEYRRSSRPFEFAATRGNVRTLTANSGLRWTSLSDSSLSPFAAGDLDTDFGVTGKVTTQFGGPEDVAEAVVIQPDGKIVCAGYSSGAISIAFVARYNADGSLDSSFGTGGKVTQDFGAGFTLATSIALQSDGKIVVAGYTRSAPPATSGFDFFLLRYNTNGTLDTTFDADGKVTTDFSSFDEADALFIQSDGKLVATGYTSNNTPDRTFAALARYNSDGSLDTSFGTGGKVLGHEGAAFSAVVQTDSQIVTGGWGCSTATCTQNLDFTFARYNTNGTLDASFGTGGKATVAVSTGRDEARSIVLQADGKIVAAGANLSAPTGEPIAVVRLNANGTLDTAFGTNGIVQNLPIVVEDVFGLSLQANGKIVTGGRVFNTVSDSDFALLRLNTDGTLDTTFSGGGITTTSFANNFDGITDFAIQSDGKIVAVGFAENQIGDIDAAMARYLTSVSVSGRITAPDGRGLRSTIVSIIDSLGVKQTATTSSFGFYTFDNLRPGETYLIVVNSRLYRFATRSLTVNDNLTNIDFVGLE